MAKTRRYRVIQAEKIQAGERKIVTIEDRSIGIFNVNGSFIAVLNLCPHEFAPVCKGRVSGTTAPSQPGEMNWVRDGEILYCPWHGWEFDLLTGDCLTDHRRLRRFTTTVENGWVYVDIREASGQ
jgi:3-phenylpropionate/trans-cinnamate dioxygenase ferredoxin subunit